MKKIVTLLVSLASCFAADAQILLQENFNAPYTLTGWSRQNLSDPAPGGQLWVPAAGSVPFNAFNGAPNDYFACTWQSTSNTVAPQTLSNWLITPTLTLANGGILEFATRTTTNPATLPDRLEVYMSTAGSGVNVGSTSSSVGTFSTLLVSVNPGLTMAGYPGIWTVYSVTLTGLGGPTPGRIGFRYHVTGGGWAGTNSNYIGLDAVQYRIPCGIVLPSYTICAGVSATIAAVGGASPTTYTWNPGSSNSSSIIVTPGSTTSYTLSYEEGGSPCPDITSTVTIGTLLSVNVSASSYTVCAGSTVTLTANSAATTYSWSNGVMAPSTTVAPTSTTTYSVGALSGFCFGGNTITINTVANPTVSASLSPTLVCQGTSYTLNASGASDYIWFNTPVTGFTNNPLVLTAGTAGPRSYTLAGFANGCASAVLVNFTVNPNPTVTATSSNSLVCTNSTVNLVGSGASSYLWSGAGSSSVSPYTYTTGASAGTLTFNVVGTSAEGCSSSSSVVVSVTVCNTNPVGIIEKGSMEETHIFPNPFSNELRISELDGTVFVYNALGQLIIDSKISGSVELKTSGLPRGVYVVKAFNTSGELVKTVKLLKN